MIQMFLFINSIQQKCGVYQYGKRLHSQLGSQFDYVEIGSNEEYTSFMKDKSYDACILNYHPSLFGWWQPTIKTFYVFHELAAPSSNERILNSDPTNQYGIPRPLYQGAYTRSDFGYPSFGSFGFGFYNKGFDRLVKMINDQYDEAIIRLLIPCAHYGDIDGKQARDIAKRCRSMVTKPNIKLLIMHDFLEDADLVGFLASNHMNIFLYDQMCSSRGCSSVIDYALSAKKPIAISDSCMFRHIYSDAICAYKRPLKDIMADGTLHTDHYLDKWNPKTLRDAVLSRVTG